MTQDGRDSRLLISYLTLRRVIGALGVLLPLGLALGCVFLGECTRIQPSISDYYSTGMRDVFVGVLFVIGWFLFAYRGYDPQDNVAGNLAGVFALGVALFPNSDAGSLTAALHYISAAALFLTLAYFSYFLFTKTAGTPTPQKLTRNKIYRTCGIVMVACIALIGMYSAFLADTSLASLSPVFWLEAVALWAFGFSWFIKGETLWADPEGS